MKIKIPISISHLLLTLASILCAVLPPTARAADKAEIIPPVRSQRAIYAHYMGCYPVACNATAYHRSHDAALVRHTGKDLADQHGGRWRNWPLVPEGMTLTLEESVDLEIRRAIRAGLDGFAIDMWAGEKANCQKLIDAMFKVAEAKDYPFGITLCFDSGDVDGLRWLLATHG